MLLLVMISLHMLALSLMVTMVADFCSLVIFIIGEQEQANLVVQLVRNSICIRRCNLAPCKNVYSHMGLGDCLGAARALRAL